MQYLDIPTYNVYIWTSMYTYIFIFIYLYIFIYLNSVVIKTNYEIRVVIVSWRHIDIQDWIFERTVFRFFLSIYFFRFPIALYLIAFLWPDFSIYSSITRRVTIERKRTAHLATIRPTYVLLTFKSVLVARVAYTYNIIVAFIIKFT